ncbi:MAG: PilZ domain-containing protein [Pseudomonadota bacterium]
MRRNAPRTKVEREERIAVVKSAYITVDGNDPMLACTVRDINSGGARISVADIHKIADEFLLIARSEDLVARVRVAWRREKEIGVRFLRSTRLDNEARMRQEQAKVFERNRAAEAQRLAEAEAAQAALEQQQAEAERMAQARLRFDRMVTLGMDPTQGYTKDMLRDAYHARAKETHPDQGGDPATFDAVKLAYEGLLAEFPA